MPVSRIVKELGPQWPAIIRRASEQSPVIPPSGISCDEYAQRVMPTVHPANVREIIGLLQARQLVWLSRAKGDAVVYGSKPAEAPGRRHEGTTTPRGRLTLALCPAFIALAVSAQRRDEAANANDYGTFAIETSKAKFHCVSIMKTCAKHEDRGMTASEIRETLRNHFASKLVEEIESHNASYKEGAKIAHMAPLEPTSRNRRVEVASLAECMLRLLRREGSKGVTRSMFSSRISSKPTAAQVDEVLADAMRKGQVESATVRTGSRGRPSVRYTMKQFDRSCELFSSGA